MAIDEELVKTLKEMETAGITTVIHSISWAFANEAEGTIKHDYIDILVKAACTNTKLKVGASHLKGARVIC